MLKFRSNEPVVYNKLQQYYQYAVNQGLEQLQNRFVKGKKKALFKRSFLHMEIHRINTILHPPLHPKGLGKLAAKIQAQVRQLQSISDEIRLIQAGKIDELLARRSFMELSARAQGPFFETEAYLHYLDSLELHLEISTNRGKDSSASPDIVYSTLKLQALPWINDFPDKQHQKLFQSLKLERLMPDRLSYSDFLQHFQDAKWEKIRWQETNTLLLYLFDRLVEARVLPVHFHTQMTQQLPFHFLDRFNKPLKTARLSVARSKSGLYPRGAERIDWIIQELSK